MEDRPAPRRHAGDSCPARLVRRHPGERRSRDDDADRHPRGPRAVHRPGLAAHGPVRLGDRAARPRRPDGETTTVAFALVPRTDTSTPGLGTIVPNPGGPGTSTIDATGALFTGALESLMDRRDVLLIDPRGVGRSDAVTCAALDGPDLVFGTLQDQRAAIGECGHAAGRPRRRLRDDRGGRRHRRGPRRARDRPARPARRLLRHLPHAGLRRAPPRPRPDDHDGRRRTRCTTTPPARSARPPSDGPSSWPARAPGPARARPCWPTSKTWPGSCARARTRSR